MIKDKRYPSSSMNQAHLYKSNYNNLCFFLKNLKEIRKKLNSINKKKMKLITTKMSNKK